MISSSDEIPSFELNDAIKENALKSYSAGEENAVNSLENFINEKIYDSCGAFDHSYLSNKMYSELVLYIHFF